MELTWKHTAQRLYLPDNLILEGRNGWANVAAALGIGSGKRLWAAGGGTQGKLPAGKWLVQRTPDHIFLWPSTGAKPIGNTALPNASQIRWPEQNSRYGLNVSSVSNGTPTVILLWQQGWNTLWTALGSGESTLIVTDGY